MTATALTLAGAMPAQGLDGVNLMPWMTGKSSAPVQDALYWRQGKRGALRQGDWKLIKDAEQWRLFDLRSDLGEQRDVAASEPQKLDQLRALWNTWSAQMIMQYKCVADGAGAEMTVTQEFNFKVD